MGANLPAKKYKKGTPAVTRLSFELDGGNQMYISIAAALSAVNRRMYRQGLYYYVQSVELHNAESAVLDIYTAPDNWVTRAAWKRGFENFTRMQRHALTDVPMRVGPYNDYKVGLDKKMMDLLYDQSNGIANTGDAQNPTISPGVADAVLLKPSLYNGGDGTAGSVNATKFRLDIDDKLSEFVSRQDVGSNEEPTTPLQFFSHLVGPHLDEGITNLGTVAGSVGGLSSVGLIKSYTNTRNTVVEDITIDDTEVADDPLAKMFESGAEKVTEDIVEELAETDTPPYNLTLYPGEHDNHLHHAIRLATDNTDVGRIAHGGGFCVPCGLIKISSSATTDARLVLNLAVGTYNGVYAERMI